MGDHNDTHLKMKKKSRFDVTHSYLCIIFKMPNEHRGLLRLPLLMCIVTLMSPVCEGHGRLIEPPSRSSMWRYGFDTPAHYEDNQLFCGGVGIQYGQNDGKCGVCGDAWNGARDHEPGGKYANGIIVRNYDVGQVINVTVDLTASHKGWFEFRICPSDNPCNKATHECFDQYPLHVIEANSNRWKLPANVTYSSIIKLKLRLPKNMKCKACVLQWKYNTGNSWGTGPDGKGCIGCGNQEQFYGCADVAVGYEMEIGKRPLKKCSPPPTTRPTPSTMRPTPPTMKPAPPTKRPAPVTSQPPGTTMYPCAQVKNDALKTNTSPGFITFFLFIQSLL